MLGFDPAATLGALAVVVLLAAIALRAVPPASRLTLIARLQQLPLALGVAFLGQAFLSYAGASWLLALPVMLLGSGLTAVLLIAWYFILRVVFPSDWAPQKVLLIDPDRSMEEAAALLQDPPLIYQSGPNADPEALLRQIQENQPDRIVLGPGGTRSGVPAERILSLRMRGVVVEDSSIF